MARCKNCPALKDDNIAVIEYYSCGDGCPDEDFDFYGGDCMNARWNQEDIEPDDALAYEMKRTYQDDIENVIK